MLMNNPNPFHMVFQSNANIKRKTIFTVFKKRNLRRKLSLYYPNFVYHVYYNVLE